jgi:hypothetical protein
MRLDELFEIHNGLSSHLVNISEDKDETFNLAYIRPSSTWSNVVAGYLDRNEVNQNYIFPKDSLFVSTDGEGSHSYAYVSPIEFVPNSNVCVLMPKRILTIREKVFYAMVITQNRYKFSYGRKPKGKRLANLIIPEVLPTWVNSMEIPDYEVIFKGSETNILSNQNLVKVSELFEVHYGTNLALNALEEVEQKDENSVNFVSRTTKNNGVSAFVKILPNLEPLPAGLLSVAAGGSVLETFVQDEPFYTGRDMYYLVPKREMTISEKLFYAFCIRANKYRYNYNRQANRTLRELKIPANLPTWFDKDNIEKQLSELVTT